jgi:hypothetical protein
MIKLKEIIIEQSNWTLQMMEHLIIEDIFSLRYVNTIKPCQIIIELSL